MGKVYRIGTWKVNSLPKVGDRKEGEKLAMDILWCLAGLIEKRELLKNYPRLGIEVNGIPVTDGEGVDQHGHLG